MVFLFSLKRGGHRYVVMLCTTKLRWSSEETETFLTYSFIVPAGPVNI